MNLSRMHLYGLLALMAGLMMLSCDTGDDGKDPIPQLPEAPNLLAVISVGQTTVTMNWNDRSGNETGFRIEQSQDEDTWESVGTVPENITQYTATGLEIETQYFFRVWAFNSAGDSEEHSNIQTATTHPGDLASPPTNVAADPLTPTSVLVTWNDPGRVDSFVVRRRTPDGDWMNVGSTLDGDDEYTDHGLNASTVYYYSVGSANENGINWSADSASVTTPEEGAPLAPSNLEADIDLGSGVTLSWTDNSSSEFGFEVARNTAGQLFEVIDTVESNVTEYFDPLADDVGRYGYRVRAFNDLGVSAWAPFITVDYRFCSNGVIPICHGNWWEYVVEDEEVEEPYTIRRSIPPIVEYISGDVHYLMIEHNLDTGEIDSLWYLRNFEDFGCQGAPWPLGATPISEPLFKYPAPLGSDYRFHGDSIVVVSHTFDVDLGDQIIQNCTVYQRFIAGQNRSIRYFVKPELYGIVMEDVIESSVPVRTATLSGLFLNNGQ